jgi:hypothetical protein
MPVPNGAMRERCERGNLTGSPYTRSAIPYVVCAALVLGLVLGEDWLQRRSGQSWWTIDQLVWGTLAAAVTVFVLVAGHPLVALLMAGFAALEFLSVRRSWVKRTSRDLLERNRLELEHRDAPAASPSGIGVRRSVFVLLIALLWTLLEHWGLSRGAAGIVSAIVAIVVFFPSQRRSSASSVTTHDGGGTLRASAPTASTFPRMRTILTALRRRQRWSSTSSSSRCRGARPSCSVGCLNAAPVAADSAAADDAPGVHRSREPLQRERIGRLRLYPVFDGGVQPLVDEDLTRLCRSA